MSKKSIKVFVPNDSGEMLIKHLMDLIDLKTKWSYSTSSEYIMVGPAPDSDIPGNGFKYIINLRNPFDILISRYKTANTSQKLDEFYFEHSIKEMVKIKMLIRRGLKFNAVFTTYEDMTTHCIDWTYNFLEQFDLTDNTKSEIAQEFFRIVADSGEITNKYDFESLLEPKTIRVVANRFQSILDHLQDVQLGYYNYSNPYLF